MSTNCAFDFALSVEISLCYAVCACKLTVSEFSCVSWMEFSVLRLEIFNDGWMSVMHLV